MSVASFRNCFIYCYMRFCSRVFESWSYLDFYILIWIYRLDYKERIGPIVNCLLNCFQKYSGTLICCCDNTTLVLSYYTIVSKHVLEYTLVYSRLLFFDFKTSNYADVDHALTHSKNRSTEQWWKRVLLNQTTVAFNGVI